MVRAFTRRGATAAEYRFLNDDLRKRYGADLSSVHEVPPSTPVPERKHVTASDFARGDTLSCCGFEPAAQAVTPPAAVVPP